jgi:hypothetical protein
MGGAGCEKCREGAEGRVGLVVTERPHGKVIPMLERVVPYAIAAGCEGSSPTRRLAKDFTLSRQSETSPKVVETGELQQEIRLRASKSTTRPSRLNRLSDFLRPTAPVPDKEVEMRWPEGVSVQSESADHVPKAIAMLVTCRPFHQRVGEFGSVLQPGWKWYALGESRLEVFMSEPGRHRRDGFREIGGVLNE